MAELIAPDVTVRPYDPAADADRIRELVGEVWAGSDDEILEGMYGEIGGRPWADWLAPAVLGYLAAPEARAFVAEEGGAVIGFCSFTTDDVRRRGTVGYNGVARSHQGRGIGAAMLELVLDGIRAAGMEFAVVLVADNAEHLPAQRNYERHGFRRFSGYHYLTQKL